MGRHLVLAAGLAVVWTLSVTVLRENGNDGDGLRLVNDHFDRAVYAQRGEWALKGTVPYRDVFSEYPQVATYVFGLPYLVSSGDRSTYYTLFALMMLTCLYGTILLLYDMLPAAKNRAYLLLLPAPLYFSYNRFDLIASFLVLLSLLSLQRGRRVAAGICLGIAALTKWYPALLLPVFLSYAYHTDRRVDWRMIWSFCLTCAVIVAPTLLAGGVGAVLQPYLFHAGRGVEPPSLPALLNGDLVRWFGWSVNQRFLKSLCLTLSVLPLLLIVRARVDSLDKVAQWSVVVIGSFVIMSTIWSPQWILWLLPLMILAARAEGDLAWIVSYGVLSYVAFPLLYDGLGGRSLLLKVVSLLVYAIVLRTAIVAYRRAKARDLVDSHAM